jgi:GT2 family glycosyltransferase
MSFAIAFVTIDRPEAAQRFVESARRAYPEVPIHVADQSRDIGRMADFYQANGVHVVRMPYDAGLSASRNRLMEEIGSEYVVLCDDDFVLGPQSKLEAGVDVLDRCAEISIVGGRLHDFDGRIENIRHWEMFLLCDERRGIFCAAQIYDFAPIRRSIGPHVVYECDAVMNFAVFRRSMFSEAVRWDEHIKINGEHEDFYLGLKRNTAHRVFYLPEMAALHYQAIVGGSGRGLRDRQEGWRYLLAKWNLSQHVEIGTGVRPLDDGSVHGWFRPYLRVPPASIVVPPSDITPTALAGLLLQGTARADEKSIKRCGLEFDHESTVDPSQAFHLWYRSGATGGTSQHCEVFIRWFSESGDALVWRSGAVRLVLGGATYWRVAAFELPLLPRGARELRFELFAVVSDATLLLTSGIITPGKPPASPAQ